MGQEKGEGGAVFGLANETGEGGRGCIWFGKWDRGEGASGRNFPLSGSGDHSGGDLCTAGLPGIYLKCCVWIPHCGTTRHIF